MIIQYGFAKINGSQFTVLDSVLDKRLEDVSGFWLTWYYFGYSQAYGWIIALVQIVGGMMLLFHRSTLLGALVLFGAMGNIIFINLFFDISTSAMTAAFVIEAALAFILWYNRHTLISAFWKRGGVIMQVDNIHFPAPFRWLTRVMILVIPALFTYWVANFNNRHPTSIDGSWKVESVSGARTADMMPERIYFEYNRAYMTVFAYPDSNKTHHFVVNESDNSLSIWDLWLRKDDLLFAGKFEWESESLMVEGLFLQDSVSTKLKLSRMRPGS